MLGEPGMSRRQTPMFALVALSLIVLVAAGCGKSKSASGTQSSTTTTTTSSTSTTTNTTTSTTTTTGSSGLSGIATSGNCLQLAGLGASFAQALTGSGGTDVQKTATLLQQFADRTPAAIRPDFQVVAAAYAKAAGALKGVNLTAGKAPSAAAMAKLAALGTEINSAALRKADADITAWAHTNCHG
jgi:hypothetical protein